MSSSPTAQASPLKRDIVWHASYLIARISHKATAETINPNLYDTEVQKPMKKSLSSDQAAVKIPLSFRSLQSQFLIQSGRKSSAHFLKGRVRF
jgi:hypothetical protein